MAAKICLVSVIDSAGMTHTAEVQAESLYEAACRGLNALKQSGWTPVHAMDGRLQIEWRVPVVRHTIRVDKLLEWLDKSGELSPKDRVGRQKLKGLLYETPSKGN